MLNGLDLFSGIGGISLALEPWVKTIAYCEINPYARAVLISRMQSGQLADAPIWDDIRTLTGNEFQGLPVDVIFGGFPCQDISLAGHGKGLEGERSGLFFQIMRLVKELKPKFVFLENVPAIRTRGLETVVNELSGAGYDCRWTMLSAAQVGALHIRKRWFLLAYASRVRGNRKVRDIPSENEKASKPETEQKDQTNEPRPASEIAAILANASRERLEKLQQSKLGEQSSSLRTSFWESEPNVGRVVNGVPRRVDRIKCLGNSVVPLQAQTAFKYLMGF